MSLRNSLLQPGALLPRLAAIVLVALGATAGLTYAAGSGITTPTTPAAATVAQPAKVVVPDVRNQAFVFAKGSLEDAGFAWKVAGSVHGYSANTVVSQVPAAGTKLIDTGSPLITLTLARNGSYAQVGQPEDLSPYEATADVNADLGPAHVARTPAKKKAATTTPKVTTPAVTTPPATTDAATTNAVTTTAPATTTTAPATTAPATTTTAAPDVSAAPATKTPAVATTSARTPDFIVPGARKEPTDEIPLTQRAAKLDAWVAAHPKPTDAAVKHWLFQNAWVVTGAKLGWWHGAEALRTLIAVDRHAQSQWGIGAKSEADARAALGYVESKTKS